MLVIVQVLVQGSFATNSTIPSSDLDLTLSLDHNSNNNNNSNNNFSQIIKKDTRNLIGSMAVKVLANGLSKSGNLRDFHINYIPKAKVPIIKLVPRLSSKEKKTLCSMADLHHHGFGVDISLFKSNGLHAASQIKRWCERFPSFLPVLHLIKYYLHVHGMDEPAEGYIGSYALTLMLRHVLLVCKVELIIYSATNF